MGGKKTKCGKIKLDKILLLAKNTENLKVECGSRHPDLIKCINMNIGICAVATSSDMVQHIIPFFKKATGYSKDMIYRSLKKGYWLN